MSLSENAVISPRVAEPEGTPMPQLDVSGPQSKQLREVKSSKGSSWELHNCSRKWNWTAMLQAVTSCAKPGNVRKHAWALSHESNGCTHIHTLLDEDTIPKLEFYEVIHNTFTSSRS